jgi:hypothetical protein
MTTPYNKTMHIMYIRPNPFKDNFYDVVYGEYDINCSCLLEYTEIINFKDNVPQNLNSNYQLTGKIKNNEIIEVTFYELHTTKTIL